MRKMMHVHHSDYYLWKAEPRSPGVKTVLRLTGLLKQAWLDSGGVCG